MTYIIDEIPKEKLDYIFHGLNLIMKPAENLVLPRTRSKAANSIVDLWEVKIKSWGYRFLTTRADFSVFVSIKIFELAFLLR